MITYLLSLALSTAAVMAEPSEGLTVTYAEHAVLASGPADKNISLYFKDNLLRIEDTAAYTGSCDLKLEGFLIDFNKGSVIELLQYKKAAYYTPTSVTDYINRARLGERAKLKPQQATKTVLGYPCNKAIYKDEENGTWELWYTTKLPGKISPVKSGVIEGVVLEAKSGEHTFTAQKVTPGAPEATKMASGTRRKTTTAILSEIEKCMAGK